MIAILIAWPLWTTQPAAPHSSPTEPLQRLRRPPRERDPNELLETMLPHIMYI